MNIQFSFKKFSHGDEVLWEDSNKSAKNSSFLSSYAWINFQKALGKEIDQYFIYAKFEDKEVLVGNLYIEIFRRKIAKFAYCPYGPIVDWDKISQETGDLRLETGNLYGNHAVEFYNQFNTFCKKYIEEKRLNLFRFDPLLPLEFKTALLNLGYKESLAPAQAKDTWILDISKSEEELRKDMADTNRNMINRGIKNEIEIIKIGGQKLPHPLPLSISDGEGGRSKARPGEAYDQLPITNHLLRSFYNLLKQTTSRKGFITYPYGYFKKQYEELNTKGMTEIFLAKHQDQYLAGALINYYKDTAYYSHAGSLSGKEISKLGAPYFLIWSIILDAKAKGYTKFNFWGALPKEITHHSLRGVSDFKMKFGGEQERLVGPVEVFNAPIRYNIQRLSDWWAYRKDRY